MLQDISLNRSLLGLLDRDCPREDSRKVMGKIEIFPDQSKHDGSSVPPAEDKDCPVNIWISIGI